MLAFPTDIFYFSDSVSSISHYLSQDVKVVSGKDKQKKRRKSSDCFSDFSLDPSAAIKIEKLEMVRITFTLLHRPHR